MHPMFKLEQYQLIAMIVSFAFLAFICFALNFTNMTQLPISSNNVSSNESYIQKIIHFIWLHNPIYRLKSLFLNSIYKESIPTEYIDILTKNNALDSTIADSLHSGYDSHGSYNSHALTPLSITKHQYDILHDHHISGHTGTTFIHLTLLTSLFFLLTLYLTITVKNAYFQRRKPSFLSLEWFAMFGTEFFIKIFLNIVTVYQSFQDHISIAMLCVLLFGIIILLYVHRARHQQFRWFSKRKVVLLEHQSQKSFISEFRSQVMLTTCICILAVDFKDFIPGYFKVEEWGIGLMDTGVALFVFSSGLVSIAARRNQHVSVDNSIMNIGTTETIHSAASTTSSTLNYEDETFDDIDESLDDSTKEDMKVSTQEKTEETTKENTEAGFLRNRGRSSSTVSNSTKESTPLDDDAIPVGETILKIIRHAVPLLALGLIRFITLWAADYQVHAHVSEYGVHWNFFFTLAIVSIYVNVFDLFLKKAGALHYLLLAIGTALLQQSFLLLGMENFIFNAPRLSLISANKEGICSVLGYLSIHYFAVAIGRMIFSSYATSKLAACEHTRTHMLYAQRWKFIAKVIFGSIGILWIYHFFFCDPNIIGGPEIFRKLIARLNIPSKFVSNPTILRSLTVPSRRILNLPYILWNVTLGLSILGSTLLFEITIDRITRYHLLREAINRNSLAIFLFANILTGLTNLFLKSLLVRDLVGIIYVTGYMVLICFFALYLHEKNITIRL